jgi:hypothetical protein
LELARKAHQSIWKPGVQDEGLNQESRNVGKERQRLGFLEERERLNLEATNPEIKPLISVKVSS